MTTQNTYPNPSSPEYTQIPPLFPELITYQTFLPLVQRPWEYASITPPPNSISIYIRTFDNNALYNAGCEQGVKDRDLPGMQNSIVFIHFGQPWKIDTQYGVRLNETYDVITTTEVANAVVDYAHGYWLCTGSDYLSEVTIAIGTSNDSSNYTTYWHGVAWAQMVIQANNLIKQAGYDSQVGVAGASNMELGFNDPDPTRNWVDGYNGIMYDPTLGEVLFYLYDIGDAAGCAPYYGDCGTSEHPDWEQDDVWYIAYGCQSCKPLPMIYAEWTQAEQWQQLSVYSFQTHGYKISFAGTITQSGACATRPCGTLDNTPDEGFLQLYTVLNSDENTSQDLDWSTDIKWWGE